MTIEETMPWLEIVTKLGLLGVLAYISQKLWAKFEAKEIELSNQAKAHKDELAAKDKQIAELNEKRITELRQIAKLDD